MQWILRKDMVTFHKYNKEEQRKKYQEEEKFKWTENTGIRRNGYEQFKN